MSSNFIDICAPDVPLFCVLLKLFTDSLQVASILIFDLSATLKELLELGKKGELRLHPELERGELIQHLSSDVCMERRQTNQTLIEPAETITTSRATLAPLA